MLPATPRSEQVFNQCALCHTIGAHAAIKLGPPLNGVAGRVWGSWPHYGYSAGLAAGHNADKVWEDATLDQWLMALRKMVPGTKMLYGGLHNPQQLADVIAYPKQFDEGGTKK